MDLIELILGMTEQSYVISQIDSLLKIKEIIKIIELVYMDTKKRMLKIGEEMQTKLIKKRNIKTLNHLSGKES